MSAPVMTFNTAGNVRSSASLGAAATASYNLDYAAKIEGQVTIKNTPGASVSTTRGLRVGFYPRYGTGPSDTTLPDLVFDLPSAVASTAESKTFRVGTGKWVVNVTNLDAANAVTVEITDATVDGMS